MSQSRKFRRAQRGQPLPPSWSKATETERTNAAIKKIAEMLPGRGLILLSAPPGTSTEDVEAIACCMNMPRGQAADIFQSMLEWWNPDVMLAQPDRDCVRALREGVDAVRDVPIVEILDQMPKTVERLRAAMNAAVESMAAVDREAGQRARTAIVMNSLQLAVEALALYNRAEPARQEPEQGDHPSGAPARAPMPEPREWPKGDTKTTLVADLLERSQNENRDQIIAMARAGKFHDFESESPTPKAMLVDVLARFGFPDLAGKARDGGYDDEHPSVAQAEELRHEVGPEMFDALSPASSGKRGKA